MQKDRLPVKKILFVHSEIIVLVVFIKYFSDLLS